MFHHSYITYGVLLVGIVHAQSCSDSISLGTASAFGVLGASTVTNTGLTVVNGAVGVSPGTAITGFPLGVATGGLITGNAVASQAQSDVHTAYTNAAGCAPVAEAPQNPDLTGMDLGGLTLTPGVYTFSSSAQLTGDLVLNGDSGDVWVFQIASTLTTASDSTVSFEGSASGCNVYWIIGSSATLGTGTKFAGNILAVASITATTGVSVAQGGLYAQNGAVTLDTNVIDSVAGCAPAPPVTTTTTSSSSTSSPSSSPTSNSTTPISSSSTSSTSSSSISSGTIPSLDSSLSKNPPNSY
jgi:type VI secretion system secreted protein VgrG